MIQCHHPECKDWTETSLLCDLHRKAIKSNPSLKREIKNIWHKCITERGRVGNMYRCFHCEKLFNDNEICGDHFPYTVGRRKDLEFCVYNGQPCCMDCNRSDNKNRKNPHDYLSGNKELPNSLTNYDEG